MENQEIQNSPRKAYIGGMIDSGATMNCRIYKDDEYRVGHRMELHIRITRSYPYGLNHTVKVCENESIFPKFEENGDRYRFSIQKIIHVKKFLEMVKPYIIDRREEVEILLNDIIPLMEEGKHKQKDGFLEVMDAVDDLREENVNSEGGKYTLEYFKSNELFDE